MPRPSPPSPSLRCGARPSPSRPLSLSVSAMWLQTLTLWRHAPRWPQPARVPSLHLSPSGGARPLSSLRWRNGVGMPDPATLLRGEAGSSCGVHREISGSALSPLLPPAVPARDDGGDRPDPARRRPNLASSYRIRRVGDLLQRADATAVQIR
jgi:hypothetical protein